MTLIAIDDFDSFFDGEHSNSILLFNIVCKLGERGPDVICSPSLTELTGSQLFLNDFADLVSSHFSILNILIYMVSEKRYNL